MAASTKPGKGVRSPKGGHGKMPVKKSINLMVIDENKISAKKAIPGILLIVLLAALFSKFLVADRLVAVSDAASEAARLQVDLNNALARVKEYGEVEETYAHYTYAGMTPAEQSLVDRTRVLELVSRVLPVTDSSLADGALSLSELYGGILANLGDVSLAEETLRNVKAYRARARQRLRVDAPVEVNARAWSVSENLLTVEVSGVSLERLNELARRIEEFDLVDSCTLTTANKKTARTQWGEDVTGRFVVYLQQPSEEVASP